MEITFVNPGADYMIQRMMDFQAEEESAFWSEPLYHFYPQLDKVYAAGLSFDERTEYIARTMRTVYAESENTINEKAALSRTIGKSANRKLLRLYRMLLVWIVPTCLMTYGVM